MPHNVPATILGIVAGAAVSISSGFLLATYVVSGVVPAYAGPPRITDAGTPAQSVETWPPIDVAGPLAANPEP